MELYTSLSRLFPDQFRQPSGWLGKIVGRLESRRNEAANEFALTQLQVETGDHVLEAGFGPGVTIEKLTRLVRRGRVVGVDFSEEMGRQSIDRNRNAVEDGRVLLCLGDICRLPLRSNLFDRVLGVSVIYFFSEPQACLAEIFRVLKPGGRICLYLTSKEDLLKVKFTQIGNFSLYTAGEAVGLLDAAGFEDAQYRTKTINSRTGICVTGHKPGRLR